MTLLVKNSIRNGSFVEAKQIKEGFERHASEQLCCRMFFLVMPPQSGSDYISHEEMATIRFFISLMHNCLIKNTDGGCSDVR